LRRYTGDVNVATTGFFPVQRGDGRLNLIDGLAAA